ncbi:DNA repair ATPase [Streptomyces koyangensis]|uniref:DNA repair ATPase n=1 Tax=Streptomyces koyangensis TaxID=188770 RepID=UPI003C2F12FF
MTTPPTASQPQDQAAGQAAPRLDGAAYDVLRDRLAAQAGELARRAGALDARRTETFGSTAPAATGTLTLRTAHPARAADLAALGDVLLFGVRDLPDTVTAGAGPAVGDVFSLHARDGAPLPEDAVPGLLDDPAFRTEFAALHRYYRRARLLRLRRSGQKLLAVFRTGERATDLRVLRWSVAADGSVAFLDARGERDAREPAPGGAGVEWTPATRDDHVLGRHPYVAVAEGVGVSTVGGHLTVTTGDDGTPAHREPVAEPLQSLADADLAHARVGPLVLLRVRPYKEEEWRHLVVHTPTGAVHRLDAPDGAFRRLPDDQGVVHPGGMFLADGTGKSFEDRSGGALEFDRELRSPLGEDVLYAYHAHGLAPGLLLSYNMLRKELAAPLRCTGWARHEDGTLAVLRADDGGEPTRVHPVQLWRTPYVADTRAAAYGGEGPLARVGNPDLVRALGACLSLARTAGGATVPTTAVYRALRDDCAAVLDRHPWLGDAELGALHEPLARIRETAGQIIDEFQHVTDLTRQAAQALDEAADEAAALVRRVRGEAPKSADGWVASLTALRRAHGRILATKELRYADPERADRLAEQLGEETAAAARRAVSHLARPDAFAVHHEDAARLTEEAEALSTAAEAAPLTRALDEHTERLTTVSEVVAGIDISDATVRTGILEAVAEVLGAVNRARATLAARRRALAETEGRAEFGAELALLAQATTAALAAADTPESCTEQLAALLLRVEDLESRFAEQDAFLDELAARREEIHEAFTTRGQTLADARARHTQRLADSADRVLASLTRRLAALPDQEAVTAFLATDPMAAKVTRTIEALREADDPVRAEELAGRLKAARQEAARAQRDRADLYADGGRTVRLGRHRFAVTTRPAELTLVPDGDTLAFALSGTDYRSPVTDPGFAATRPYWEQTLPSESAGVYRAEHLAARLLATHGADALAAADLPALVRAAAEAAPEEGYERGVHDHDTVRILGALLPLHQAAGLLRFPAAERAAAQLFWAHHTAPDTRAGLARRARSLARARAAFGPTGAEEELRAELAAALTASGAPGTEGVDTGLAAAYLFEELADERPGFVTGGAARALLEKFRRTAGPAYDDDLAALGPGALPAAHQLVTAWLTAATTASGDTTEPGDLAEAAALELCPELDRYEGDAPLTATAEGLLGDHPRIHHRTLALRLDTFLARTRHFTTRTLPGFRAYQARRAALVAAERDRLRLDQHRTGVLTSFVRNRLIDEVYLPLIGDNLAKQLGAAGAARRTDHSGLLLLLSPPGYGKTTLMEYVADRLGLLRVRVDGPAIGHRVTSLDPAEAPDATARQEIEKINFALAAGSNTLLHIDDIQHLSPELLQKFIPLCDAQRRVDGVQDGRARSYDLRGKRFAICMTGNPYTESGHLFRVPDMLANRADVWNLGDVLTGKEDAFAQSFVENALTSHPDLAPLAGRDRADLDLFLRLARGDASARPDQLLVPCPPAERERATAVLRHLLAARETVLAVNAAYIASAAQADETRTEPPFRLQGSYRNMNRIAERLSPVMDEAELAALLDDHYRAEAQTLTGGAEANLLKLAALRGRLTEEQAARWDQVCAAHVRHQAIGGADGDQLGRAVAALGLLADRLAAVEGAIRGGGS